MQILGLRAVSANIWSLDTTGCRSSQNHFLRKWVWFARLSCRSRISADKLGYRRVYSGELYMATPYGDPVKARWSRSTVLELKNGNFYLQTLSVNSPCRGCISSLEAKGVFLSCMTVSLIKFGKHQCKWWLALVAIYVEYVKSWTT